MDPNVQQPQQQEVSQAAPQQEQHQEISHSSLSKVLWTILGAIIVLGLIGGAYYLGVQKGAAIVSNEKTTTTAYTQSITDTPTITSVPTVDPTANWKTYQSHSFTLKYPPTWTYKEYAYQPARTFFYDPSTASNTGNGNGTLYKDNLQIVRVPSSLSGQTVKEFVDIVQSQQIPALASSFKRKIVSLNGKETEVYYVGGEGVAGWYIPFSRGYGFDVFGPIAKDPTQDSIELQTVKTFTMTQ